MNSFYLEELGMWTPAADQGESVSLNPAHRPGTVSYEGVERLNDPSLHAAGAEIKRTSLR
jgi:hypothetical protein